MADDGPDLSGLGVEDHLKDKIGGLAQDRVDEVADEDFARDAVMILSVAIGGSFVLSLLESMLAGANRDPNQGLPPTPEEQQYAKERGAEDDESGDEPEVESGTIELSGDGSRHDLTGIE